MSTNILKAGDIKRSWYLFDAKDKVLGRLAVEVAKVLSGKNKTNYVPYLDNGDFVVVTNASKVKVTGKKSQQKTYARHSGYPGGYREETFDKLIQRRPDAVIRHAVKGMLPKTKLADKMITKLYVFPDSEHAFTKQLAKKTEEVNGNTN